MGTVHYLPSLVVVSAAELWHARLERERQAKQDPVVLDGSGDNKQIPQSEEIPLCPQTGISQFE
jgi:hypothetical protein